MRQLAVMLLAALLLQGAYRPVSQAPDTLTMEGTGAALAQTILDSQSDGESYTALSAEDVEFYLSQVYGIPADNWGEGAYIYTVGGVDAREIAVIYGLEPEENNAVAGLLEAYRKNRVGDFLGYAPEEATLAENGIVLEGGGAVLLICTDPEAAQKALAEKIEVVLYMPAEGDQFDENGYRIFEAPNKVDMSIYDTSAIRTAYVSGDESGLTGKDAAILARCREILAACVTEDMTDFEKELALHNWLVSHVSYDPMVRDRYAPVGLPDNNNPYGALVWGYGICIGYATSFQLLMDLAGVECITVVGASADSVADHAWNMVRLEGEWYCVDPTWDDPKTSTGQDVGFLWGMHHRYFNVTSDYMRETDHQWDYDSVPEATATRFRWDGVGQKPV